jgi:hypothetical protein
MSDRPRDPSFNPDCLSCISETRHDADSLRVFHPYAGHGFTKERGWSHPDLEPKEAASNG